MLKHEFQEMVETYLDHDDLESLLERYDLTPTEAMMILWENGFIDDEREDEDDTEFDINE